jgi:hypothetical protein
MMRFINYSDRPLIELPTFCQNGGDHRGTKPNGIWLSVVGEDGSDSWKVYCDANGIALKKHRTEIVIKENARILRLRSAAEVDSLTSTHGYFPECPAEFLKSDPNYVRSAICWRRVAEDYDGIVIAPEPNGAGADLQVYSIKGRVKSSVLGFGSVRIRRKAASTRRCSSHNLRRQDAFDPHSGGSGEARLERRDALLSGRRYRRHWRPAA